MMTFDKAEVYEYASVQIRVRNNDYLVGWALANDIKTLLHGLAGEIWNGTTYTLIKALNSPFLLGRDKGGAMWFVVDFEIQRR